LIPPLAFTVIGKRQPLPINAVELAI
jgi:hypothetical protein